VLFTAQHNARHDRHQRPREHVRSAHGEDYGQRQRGEQETGGTVEEDHCDEHDTDGHRGNQGRDRDLAGAIQRVAQFADERSGAIRMRLDKNEIKISSSSTETGESEDTIETAYAADPVTIGFNSQYLLDFLKVASGGEVSMELKDSQSAGQLRPDDKEQDYKYRYIVMPMRI